MRILFTFFMLLVTSIVSAVGNEEKYEAADPSIEITCYKREAVIPFLTTLHDWTVSEFGKEPYLYAPPAEQLVSASDLMLINCPGAELAIARKDGKIVGMVGSLPFDAPEVQDKYFSQYDLMKKMRTAGFESKPMLYVAFFLTAPECHNDPNVVDALYASTINHAYSEGKSELCYMEDMGPASTKIEPWGAAIHNCISTSVQVAIPWPTKQGTGVKEVSHTLEFFVHRLL